MTKNLQHLTITRFITETGAVYHKIPLSYQIFGLPLAKAPVVLVNHALTGNSEVAGENGWWKEIIGSGKAIDTNSYTVLAFNIPGNGFDGFLIKNYTDFCTRDVARLFLLGLDRLKIKILFAAIGGSVGGGLAWEMAALKPELIENLIPIAADWKSTDWLLANTLIQDRILNNSKYPIHDARLHAMLCYRTPQSFKKRFNRSVNSELGIFNIESWLLHHGKKLQDRFHLKAYKLMNRLLASIDITRHSENFGQVVAPMRSKMHLIAIDSDLYFTAAEQKETVEMLKELNKEVSYHEIKSIHGHDAFLMEFEQLSSILNQIFKPQYVANRQ